jgi:hypothetical protein
MLPSGSLVHKVCGFALIEACSSIVSETEVAASLYRLDLLQAIEELIEHLDQQKDEAIARTFSQVSKYGGLTVTGCTVYTWTTTCLSWNRFFRMSRYSYSNHVDANRNFTDIFGRLTKSTNGKAELVIHVCCSQPSFLLK